MRSLIKGSGQVGIVFFVFASLSSLHSLLCSFSARVSCPFRWVMAELGIKLAVIGYQSLLCTHKIQSQRLPSPPTGPPPNQTPSSPTSTRSPNCPRSRSSRQVLRKTTPFNKYCFRNLRRRCTRAARRSTGGRPPRTRTSSDWWRSTAPGTGKKLPPFWRSERMCSACTAGRKC